MVIIAMAPLPVLSAVLVLLVMLIVSIPAEPP